MARRTASPWIALAALSGFVACSDDSNTVAAAFATPSGVTVAGSETVRLFVANRGEDALQVMQLADDLDDLRPVPSPAQFFPLRIPVGPGPTELVTTANKRWVVVLNSVNQSLSLVDADSLEAVVFESGTQFGIGGSQAAPVGLASPPIAQDCGEGCEGLIYVSLSGQGAIFEIAVETSEGPQLVVRRLLSTGGSPGAIAVDPAGTLLFAVDGASPDVIRVDLLGGSVDRVDIGVLGGPIAVTTDGNAVIVGRPDARDVVILDEARSGAFAVVDTNPAWVPRPSCVADCSATDVGICGGAHPADTALCRDGDSLQEEAASPYAALYLGGVPARILTLGMGAGDSPLSVPCTDEDEVAQPARQFSEFAMVAQLNGTVYAVGIEPMGASTAAPEHADLGWCRSPALEFSPDPNDEANIDAITAQDFLTACPEVPDRRRFSCVESDTGVGAVGFPGETGAGATAWFVWEGLLDPNLYAETGGGELLPASTGGGALSDRFFDDSIDFSAYDIRPQGAPAGHHGDILEILSRPRDDDEGACRQALGQDPVTLCPSDPDAYCCALERRIIALEDSAEGTALRLDSPLPVACFSAGAIRYRVRAGDQFVVPLSYSSRERLSPGELYGPAVGNGFAPRMSFRIRDFDAHGDLDACDRYDEQGKALAPLDPLLQRFTDELDAPSFQLRMPFGVDRAGRTANSSGVTVNAGSLPGGMALAPLSELGPVVFVSYSASNSLLGFVPFEADYGTIINTGKHRLIR